MDAMYGNSLYYPSKPRLSLLRRHYLQLSFFSLAFIALIYIFYPTADEYASGFDFSSSDVRDLQTSRLQEQVDSLQKQKEKLEGLLKDEKEGAKDVRFVSFYYPERNVGWSHWRLNGSGVVVRKNDALLKEMGLGGLLVFTTESGRPIVEEWGVGEVRVVDSVEEECKVRKTEDGKNRNDKVNELCPKRIIMTDDAFLSLGSVVFLDSDAQIIDKKFVEKIVHYKRFADFAATPDQTAWDAFAYKDWNTEFNTGMFFMNTKAFKTEDFVQKMKIDCKEERQQRCFHNYLLNHRDELWIEFLPWKMHCRGKFYGKGCLLVHNWGKVALHGLDWVLSNWDQHLQTI